MTSAEDKHNSVDYPKPAYAWYVVVLMMIFYVLSFMDRQIIAVLIDPIKADMSLSDVQISLIGGLSFGLFYSTVGIFIGRLADSMHRPWLIAMGVFIWSLTTAVSGLASKFWQLLVLRMGVGLGESALLPSTLSLLTDYFPPKRLATPTSVFLLGAPIGIGLSFAAGGYLFSVAQDITAADGWNDVFFIGGSAAWKLVLLFLGTLGMIMTLGLMTVREPRTMSPAAAKIQKEKSLKASEAAKLADVKTYAKKYWLAIASLYVGMALISLAAYSQGFWDITFLARTYDRDPSTVTFMYGMVQLFGGLCGMLFAGITADRLSKRGVQGASVIMVIIGAAIATPFSFLYPLMGTASSALWLMIFAIFGSNMGFACAASAVQRMFPASMLGLAAGIYFFLSNSVGLLIGPTVVAALTDYVFADADKVGYSLSIVGGTSRLLAFVIFIAGLKAYKDLLREREAGLAV
ncbi:MAG: MFS transporter [Gammaproteobacteria bacterium]|nr:MFS transporter [Gammaproteobacteria bacterium]